VQLQLHLAVTTENGSNLAANIMANSTSSEANSMSISQDIPYILWNLKLHYCVHNSLSLVPTLRKTNLTHTLPPCFFKIQSTSFRLFKLKPSMHFPSPPCKPHTLSIAFSFITEQARKKIQLLMRVKKFLKHCHTLYCRIFQLLYLGIFVVVAVDNL